MRAENRGLSCRGTDGSNPSPSTRESGEIDGSSRSVAHRYLQLHAIVRTQLGGPPTVAGFKVLILRLQPRAETVRPEGVGRPRVGAANRSSPLIGRCPARIVAQSISASGDTIEDFSTSNRHLRFPGSPTVPGFQSCSS